MPCYDRPECDFRCEVRFTCSVCGKSKRCWDHMVSGKVGVCETCNDRPTRETITFAVPGKPVGKQRARVGKGGHFYTPGPTKEYQATVLADYLRAGHPIRKDYVGPFEAVIDIDYAVPESWTKARKLRALRGELFPTNVPDADNVAKSVLDALNHVAYHDDSQCVDLRIRCRYAIVWCVGIRLTYTYNDSFIFPQREEEHV